MEKANVAHTVALPVLKESKRDAAAQHYQKKANASYTDT
jgi:hypothetical protein